MKNIKMQNSFSQEEPVLNYLLEKVLKKDPRNKGVNVKEQVSQIEKSANDLIKLKNPKIESRFDEIADNFSQEEVSEMLTEFFEELADQNLTEMQQMQKANIFLGQFGFKLSQDRNGSFSIVLL